MHTRTLILAAGSMANKLEDVQTKWGLGLDAECRHKVQIMRKWPDHNLQLNDLAG